MKKIEINGLALGICVFRRQKDKADSVKSSLERRAKIEKGQNRSQEKRESNPTRDIQQSIMQQNVK